MQAIRIDLTLKCICFPSHRCNDDDRCSYDNVANRPEMSSMLLARNNELQSSSSIKNTLQKWCKDITYTGMLYLICEILHSSGKPKQNEEKCLGGVL